MFDRIEQRVMEIRKQPEHIRLRYMWGAVVVAMIFVIIIWIMSIQITFFDLRSDKDVNESLNQFQEQFEQIDGSIMSNPDTISIDEILEQTNMEQNTQ